MDINTLTLPELKKLHKDVQRAIESYETRHKAAAIAELEEKARELGFSLSELTGISAPKSKRRAPAVAKYRNPQNPEETWSGRGRPPRWLSGALAGSGAKLEDFAI